MWYNSARKLWTEVFKEIKVLNMADLGQDLDENEAVK